MSMSDKLITITENVPKVYEAGKNDEWNCFWDNFQNGGGRTDYQYAFRNWNYSIFKPKYNMKPTGYGAMYMFQSSAIVDLKNCGVDIDFSRATDLSNTFLSSTIKNIGIVDCRGITPTGGAPRMQFTFSGCTQLESIEKLILPVTTYQLFYQAFKGCKNLKNLTLEGSLNSNGFDVSECTQLTKTSLLNIINALAKTTSSKTITLGEANIDKLTDNEIQSILDKGWTIA